MHNRGRITGTWSHHLEPPSPHRPQPLRGALLPLRAPSTASQVLQRQPPVGKKRREEAIFFPTPNGGFHALLEDQESPLSPQAPHQVQVAKERFFAKAAEPAEHLGPHEDGLVPKRANSPSVSPICRPRDQLVALPL